MKICLVGSILRHTVESDAGIYSGWGGMTESAVAPFAALLGDDSKIHFVGSVGKEDLAELKEFFRTQYPLVDTSGIFINPAGTDHHHGTKHFVRRKVQVEPTKYEHIEPHAQNADVVIFNFGNIDDIDPEAIKKVKENSKALVYVDVHRKPYGADERGQMYRRGWPGWEKYLKFADVVQMNTNECEALFGTTLVTLGDIAGCAQKVLEVGAGQAIITLGKRGLVVGHRAPSYTYFHAPAVPAKSVDTTGCGDAFAAGFLAGFHETKSLYDAVKLGSLTAAINSEFAGYMKNITREDIKKRTPAHFKLTPINFGKGPDLSRDYRKLRNVTR